MGNHGKWTNQNRNINSGEAHRKRDFLCRVSSVSLESSLAEAVSEAPCQLPKESKQLVLGRIFTIKYIGVYIYILLFLIIWLQSTNKKDIDGRMNGVRINNWDCPKEATLYSQIWWLILPYSWDKPAQRHPFQGRWLRCCSWGLMTRHEAMLRPELLSTLATIDLSITITHTFGYHWQSTI